MNYNQLMRTICDTEPSDWLRNDAPTIFTLKDDLDIRVEEQEGDEGTAAFHEPWANGFPDPNARRVMFTVFYRASWVKEFMLVAVDGYRAYLPLPKAGTNQIPREQYCLARIVDWQGTLDQYIQRAKLESEPEPELKVENLGRGERVR